MKCHGSKFLLVLILTFAVGVGVVRVWQNFINPLNPTQTNNLPVPTKTIEFQQSIYQPRQRSCEEIKNWQGEFAPKKHTIKGGVLNWEACLIEPIYPQEAIENKVDGQVNVEVLVDGYGKVKTAKAVSGNPLLWKSAVDAAYKTQVCPRLLGGEPMNVRGILIYKFILPN